MDEDKLEDPAQPPGGERPRRDPPTIDLEATGVSQPTEPSAGSAAPLRSEAASPVWLQHLWPPLPARLPRAW
jgi:hypothetical protein